MTTVLGLFSVFLFVRVEQQLIKLSINNNSTEVISKERAIDIVQSANLDARVTDVEEESLHDKLVYTVELLINEQETDVYIDRVTGEILASADDGVEVETVNDVLINDFEENLLGANVIVLLLTIFLSYFLAGATLRPIQRKMKQQEQFSLDVAHEIRTPLSAIMAAADSVLIKEETVQTYQEILRDIKREAKRLNGLTEDLLATARSAQSTEFVKVDMNKVINNVLNRLAGKAREKNVRFELLVEQAFTTFGNKIMLERMLENVVHNAIKFSHQGGIVKIVIRDKVVRISDSGIGMSPEHKTHMFERLYTADSARNEYNKNGVGLGLAIVRQIADLHKITITVDSEEDSGTTFKFSFLH
jgi:signal transduction histidine kinase